MSSGKKNSPCMTRAMIISATPKMTVPFMVDRLAGNGPPQV
jgi:hypothetical protein